MIIAYTLINMIYDIWWYDCHSIVTIVLWQYMISVMSSCCECVQMPWRASCSCLWLNLTLVKLLIRPVRRDACQALSYSANTAWHAVCCSYTWGFPSFSTVFRHPAGGQPVSPPRLLLSWSVLCRWYGQVWLKAWILRLFLESTDPSRCARSWSCSWGEPCAAVATRCSALGSADESHCEGASVGVHSMAISGT